MSSQTSAAPVTPVRRRRFTGRHVLPTLAAVWLAVVVVGVLGAKWLAPYEVRTQDFSAVFAGPSAAHLLGTDSLGRDVLSRLMVGGMPTLVGVSIAVLIFLVVGVTLGLLAGYLGSITDRVLVSVATILVSMPGLVVLFVVLSIYRGNTVVAMAVFGFMASPTLVFLVRSAAMNVRNELYVDAAKVSGLSNLRIMFSHVLPRVRGVVIVQVSVFAATALIVESTLSYLGFGTQAPNPSWGNMVNEAALRITQNPFMLYPTGGIIALTAISIGLFGDLARDSLSSLWSSSALTRRAVDRKRQTGFAASDGTGLRVENLNIGYSTPTGVVSIVRDVNFEIRPGRTLALVGESGSGKTSVAFGVLGVGGSGMVVSGGTVRFDGTDLAALSDSALADFRGKRIAYVAQEPIVALDPSRPVGRLLRDALRFNDPTVTAAGRDDRAKELLEQVELPDPSAVMRKYAHELSGGMAQRVSIAIALAGRPELLVADEPTTALDVTVQASILGLLMRLREQTSLSLLVITHDWGVVADIADDVAVMYRGELVEKATAEEIFRRPAHPYTQALLASNPHGTEPGVELPVVTGDFPGPLDSARLLREGSVA